MSDGRFAGVDWASEEHAACVVDERGRIVEGRRYTHSNTGKHPIWQRLGHGFMLCKRVDRQQRIAPPGTLPVGLQL
jgi:hypothetical protein